MFGGANSALVTLSAGLSTTYTGLVLYNPLGSGKNLVPNKVGVASKVAQTSAQVISLGQGFSATAFSGVTALTPKSKFIGQPAGVGLLASAATLPVAPTYDMVLGLLDTGAITVATEGLGLLDVEGSYVIPPGGYLCILSDVGSVASSMWHSMQWEELPV
jgi:hypothetical protein